MASGWRSGAEGRLLTLSDAPFAFWSSLECRADDIDALVRRSADELGHAACVPAFPHSDVVLAGLRSTSEYWQSLALARVRGASDRSAFVEDLRRLVRDGATQRLRHEAKKLAAAAR